MALYKDETLKQYPWLWKYDRRFKRGCRYQGHRFHWNQFIKRKSHMVTIGVCLRCPKVARVGVQFKNNKWDVLRVISDDEPLMLSSDEIKRLKELLKAKDDKQGVEPSPQGE